MVQTGGASVPEPPDRARSRIGLLSGLLTLFAVGVLLQHAWRFRHWLIDDVFITFRYSENLARGAGPVFNPGEPVEGYTSFLWMAMLAAAQPLGLDTLTPARWLTTPGCAWWTCWG